MRTVAIDPVLVDVPLAAPVQGVHGTTSVQRSVLVRVTTDEGVEGWGNVDPTPGYSLVSAVDIHDAVARLAPVLAGADPFNLHRALACMDRETEEGIARVAAVRAAVGDRLALRVDFNESLTLVEAVSCIRRLEPYALTLVEQPIA